MKEQVGASDKRIFFLQGMVTDCNSYDSATQTMAAPTEFSRKNAKLKSGTPHHTTVMATMSATLYMIQVASTATTTDAMMDLAPAAAEDSNTTYDLGSISNGNYR